MSILNATAPVDPHFVPPLDLTSCDREPIHVPGHVQPHGTLLAVDPERFVVRQASANAERVIGMEVRALLGQPLSALLGRAQTAHVREVLDGAIARGESRTHFPVKVTLAVRGAARLFDVAVHRHLDAVILEFEEGEEEDASSLHTFHALVRQTLARVREAATVDALAQGIAEQVRVLTGYDRVWIYRFHPDLHGEIIAESRSPGIESWLGLHYPASDIPAPARALFLANPLRVIADVDATPAPILSITELASSPLDLSGAVLRGVSPVHIQYLQNMRVRASFSISLVRNGRLWGLISAHHYSGPRVPPYEVRTVCEFLGQAFSAQLGLVEDAADRGYVARVQATLARLVGYMGRADDMARAVTDQGTTLCDLVEATGAAIVTPDELLRVGEVPPDDELRALADWVSRQVDTAAVPDAGGGIVATDSLATIHPAAAGWTAYASGMLALRVPSAPSLAPAHCIFWFRPEHERTIRWGGDPAKPVQRDPDGTERLTPRASFAEWRELVRGRCRPWIPCEIEAAREVRAAYAEFRLRRLEERLRLGVQREIEPEIRALLDQREVHETLRLLQAMARRDGAARLDEVSARIDSLILTLLEFSRVGRSELARQAVSMQEVAEEVLRDLAAPLAARRVEARVAGPLPTVSCDADRAREILRILVSDAVAQAGDEASARTLEVTVAGHADAPVFVVRSDGAPIEEGARRALLSRFTRLAGGEQFPQKVTVGLAVARRMAERHGGHLWIEEGGDGRIAVHFTLGAE